MPAYLRAGPESWQRSSVPEMPGVPDSGDGGLRAANTRLRELLAERDARIAEQAAENAALREALAELQSQVADLAAQVKTNSRNSIEAAVVGRPGQAVPEVPARQVRTQARQAGRPARDHGGAHGPPG